MEIDDIKERSTSASVRPGLVTGPLVCGDRLTSFFMWLEGRQVAVRSFLTGDGECNDLGHWILESREKAGC